MVDSQDSEIVSGDVFVIGDYAWQVCLVISDTACLASNVFFNNPCLVDLREATWVFKGGKVVAL